MSDIVFPAHELLNYTSDELRNILTGEFYLEFPDGILKTNDRETIITAPLWDWIRKRDIPLKMEYHLSHHMQKRMYHKNLHMDVLNIIHWDIYEAYKKNGRFVDYDLLEDLVEEFYKHGNKQYNLMVRWLSKYVSSTSIRDVIKLFDVPAIAKLLNELRPTEESVLQTTREITNLIAKSNDPEIRDNRVVRMARSGVIKLNQLVQAIAPTGFIEDLGGEIFKYPLMSNYTDGHRSLYDNMVESRKASQAIDATKAELEDAVYQSRRQEILNEIVMNIHPGDCGTTEFLPIKLRAETDLTKSDLELMSGKYYYDPENDPDLLREITPKSTEILGRVIHMRVFTKCAHPDSNGVCECCVGAMALTIPRRTNLGQIMTTDLYAFLIQRQLSKKHYMANSVVQKLRVTGEDAKYLRAGADGISYYVAPEMQNAKYKIVISREDGKSITDVLYLTDIDRVAIGRITEMGSLSMVIDYGDYSDRYPIVVGTGKRKASFSHDMLKYVKERYWEIDDKDNFIIDMCDWDTSKPLAFVPMKNDSLIDFSQGFKSHIESEVKKEEQRDLYTNPDDFLMETFDILNSELSINMVQVETAVYGIMIRSAAEKQYALPKPWSKAGIGVMGRVMAMRSLSATMAFEKHSIIFSSPDSFIAGNRPDHPMDAVISCEILPRA